MSGWSPHTASASRLTLQDSGYSYSPTPRSQAGPRYFKSSEGEGLVFGSDFDIRISGSRSGSRMKNEKSHAYWVVKKTLTYNNVTI